MVSILKGVEFFDKYEQNQTVVGVEKLIQSKMMLPGSNRRIHSVHRHSGMTIPKRFAKKAFAEDPFKTPFEVLLCYGQLSSWVDVRKYKLGVGVLQAKLCSDWKDFVKRHKIEAGDVLVF